MSEEPRYKSGTCVVMLDNTRGQILSCESIQRDTDWYHNYTIKCEDNKTYRLMEHDVLVDRAEYGGEK